MIFTKYALISDLIIKSLAHGPLDTLELLEKLKNERYITKQGFYKSLRTLTQKEVLIKNKQVLTLSPVWLGEIEKFLTKVQKHRKTEISNILMRLQDGDSMVFRLKSTTDLYLLWSHYFKIFCKHTDGPIVFFNSHNFWPLLRKDIEKEVYGWVKAQRRKAYSVIGNNTKLDRTSSQFLKKDYNIKISFEEKPSLKETVFPVVFGDYIISSVLKKHIVQEINKLFLRYEVWGPQAEKELQEIMMHDENSKLVIEKNTKKAEKIRKKILNHFMFYKSKK